MRHRRAIARILLGGVAALALALLTPVVGCPGSRPAVDSLRSALNARRQAPPLDPELLIVDVGADPDPALLAEAVLALEELGAARLIVGEAARAAAERRVEPGRQDIEALFETEFGAIDRHIRASFEAIRYGSVRTRDAPAFIDALARLVGSSRERLLAILLDEEREVPNPAARALELFKGRSSSLEETLGAMSPDHGDAVVMVDEAPPEGRFERRLALAEALGYARLDEIARERLFEMEAAGYMLGLAPDDHPLVASDHALRLRAEALARPGAAVAWRAARERAMATLLSYPVYEARLLAGYDELLASSEGADAEQARALREACARDFAALRGESWRLAAERERLASLVSGATAIVADAGEGERIAVALNAAEAGRWLILPSSLQRRLWIALPGLVVAVATAWFSPAVTLGAGLLAAIAAAAAYAAFYVQKGVWLEPQLAALAAMLVALASSGLARLLTRRAEARTRQILARRVGERLARRVARRVARQGSALPEGYSSAVIVAVRDLGSPAGLESAEAGLTGEARGVTAKAQALKAFHGEAAAALEAAGAVVLAIDEFVVLAGFGTALGRAMGGWPGRSSDGSLGAATDAALRFAYAATADRPGGPDEASRRRDWRVGLASGACVFYASRLDGYGCLGTPPTHARVLSSLAQGYDARVLASKGFVDEFEAAGTRRLAARRLDSLVDKASGAEEAFFAIEAARA